MLDDILAAVQAMGEAEEITVTVTTVTVKPRTAQRATGGGRLDEDPAADGLTHSHRAVLAAVRAGHTRPTEIEDAVGLKHRRVAYLLAELVASGHLIQPRYGRYQAAA